VTRRILIAERDAGMQACLKFLMEREGHVVEVVGDGQAAMDRAAEAPPDLALITVDLEKCDGYDLCRSFRADPALAKTKIIMVTARASAVDRDKGMALGADDYVGKPFANADLVARVREVLDGGD